MKYSKQEDGRNAWNDRARLRIWWEAYDRKEQTTKRARNRSGGDV
jgi:hypothetical protein